MGPKVKMRVLFSRVTFVVPLFGKPVVGPVWPLPLWPLLSARAAEAANRNAHSHTAIRRIGKPPFKQTWHQPLFLRYAFGIVGATLEECQYFLGIMGRTNSKSDKEKNLGVRSKKR